MFTFCPSSVWSKSVITINLLGPAWRSSFTSCVKPELKREPAGAAAIRGAKGLMASRTLQTLDVKWDFWSPREFQAIGQSQHLFQGMKHHRKTGSTNWRLRSSDNRRGKKTDESNIFCLSLSSPSLKLKHRKSWQHSPNFLKDWTALWSSNHKEICSESNCKIIRISTSTLILVQKRLQLDLLDSLSFCTVPSFSISASISCATSFLDFPECLAPIRRSETLGLPHRFYVLILPRTLHFATLHCPPPEGLDFLLT